MNSQRKTSSHSNQVQRELEEKEDLSNLDIGEEVKETVEQNEVLSNSSIKEDINKQSIEQILSVAEIQMMEAGSVVDVSRMETQVLDSLFYSEVPGEEIVQGSQEFPIRRMTIFLWRNCVICGYCIRDLTGRLI